MKKKQFKTESRKLLDMMINSIYTNKEIFLRELISNASDAIDKLYFRSLTDPTVKLSRADYSIFISVDRSARTLTITDNGCGMTGEEMETNLGTIAKSGSFDFKAEGKGEGDVDIIGQFGVGFYSAFMVADKITVTSRPFGSEIAYKWESEGVDGYTVGECEKATFGTEIVLHIKEDSEEESFSEFLDEYRIRTLVKKYSDYIRYPIKMEITKRKKADGTDELTEYTEVETLNSMVPIWKRGGGEVTEEEYARYYSEKFFDYEAPARVITQKSEGTATFSALMFIPSHAPYNYYTKEFEKGLELYSSGVMIMERCADLLPDYFGFVRGIVDSSDLSLNISREMLQHDRQLKVMAKAIEKKIKGELEKMLRDGREGYEKFFDAFGLQLKYGIYADYGMHKDTLVDLIMFKSSREGKYVTLREYTEGMAEGQDAIYYASGESATRIEMLPQVRAVKARGYEVLYLTDEVDEFALRVLGEYKEKPFKNVTAESLDLGTEEEKAREKSENEDSSSLLNYIKEVIGGVSAVKFSASLGDTAACLSTEGELSVEMAKILGRLPGADEMGAPEASIVLEINLSHPIAERLKALFGVDNETLQKYAKMLWGSACLVSGIALENPIEYTSLVAELMSK